MQTIEKDSLKLPLMTLFRKRPVVVQACKMDTAFSVATLEGTMRGEAGDYLICGIKGEYYPCRADIFEATYEPTI